MVGTAYQLAATMENVVDFKSTSISLYNPDVFEDSDFAPAVATETGEPDPSAQIEDQALAVAVNVVAVAVNVEPTVLTNDVEPYSCF